MSVVVEGTGWGGGFSGAVHGRGMSAADARKVMSGILLVRGCVRRWWASRRTRTPFLRVSGVGRLRSWRVSVSTTISG